MDAIIKDYAPQLFAMYRQLSPYIAPIQATILHIESLFYRFAYPTLWPVYRATTFFVRRALDSALNTSNSSHSTRSSGSSSSPLSVWQTDVLVTVLSSVLLLWLSLSVLGFVRRQIVWWISLVTSLATWGVLIGSGIYVYSRGFEQSLDDLLGLLGLLAAWVQTAMQTGERVANEREWDAERFRRAGAGAGGGGGIGGLFGGAGAGQRQHAHQRPLGRRGW